MVTDGPALKKGDRSPRVELLRKRLQVEYGIPTSIQDPQLFDENLEIAVKYFQK